MREENLEGHMPKEGQESSELTEESKKEEKDQRVKMLLEKDNQVRHALQLLQTWTVFSHIKAGPWSIFNRTS